MSVVIGLMSSGCVGLWRLTNPAVVEFLDYGNSDVPPSPRWRRLPLTS